MNSKIMKLYAVLAARLQSVRDEKGQGTLEYVGIAIVASILVLAVVDAVTGANIGSVITREIGEITGAG
jgi:hypothetical protein